VGRLCKLCGQPVADHELRAPEAGEAAAHDRALPGRHPAQLRAALVGGQVGRPAHGRLAGKAARNPEPLRVCPVVPTQRTRPDGSAYTAWVPRRRVPDDAA
jgi:hypothetical protein